MPRATTHVKTAIKSDIWHSDVWKVEDDWKEVDSKEEKKRRQNRINQRAYRRRNPIVEKPAKQRPFRVERFRIPDKAVLEKQPEQVIVPEGLKSDVGEMIQVEKCAVPIQFPSACPEYMGRPEVAEALQPLTNSNAISDTSLIYNTSYDAFLGSVEQAGSNVELIDSSGSMTAATILPTTFALEAWMQDPLHNSEPGIVSQITPFYRRDSDGQTIFRMSLEQLNSPYSPENTFLNPNTTPSNPNNFPLSSDHLLRLIHFNVFRGLITNKSILSGRTLQTKIHLEIILPNSRNLCDGLALIRSKPGQTIPSSLNPTYVQASIAHSSWFNMFPFPAVRDNLIKAEKDFDHEELCFDLFGEMISSWTLESRTALQDGGLAGDEYEDDDDDDVTAKRKGLILWGEPWDMNAWEVTPGFVKKWAWSLKNCYELIDSTNRWRSMRDEKPLPYPFATVSEAW